MEKTAEKLFNESRLNGDLVVSTYVDKYDKLTHKVLYAYSWARRNCPSAKFLVKVDDDVLLNYFRLPVFLRDQLANVSAAHEFNSTSRGDLGGSVTLPRLVVGPKNNNFEVIRDPTSKWFVNLFFFFFSNF